jgi:hypothetical protein
MRIQPHYRNDALDLALGIEFYSHFGCLEVDRPARLPRLTQQLIKLVQMTQMG